MNGLKEEDLELSEYAQYYGTLNYYKGWLGVSLTDGVKYVSDNGYSWLVTDCISVIKAHKKVKEYLKEQTFLVVELILKEGKKALMRITDGNNNILYEQKYDYTDAKKEFKMFFCNNVLMLNGEY